MKIETTKNIAEKMHLAVQTGCFLLNKTIFALNKTDMARFLTATIALLLTMTVRAQIVDESWRDHLSYNYCKTVAVSSEEVYCASSASLFCYGKSDGRIRHLTTIEGLSDMGVGSIAYSDENHRLVIGYSNGNIDLMDDNGKIYNMPGLKDKNMSISKNINHINFDGSRAFLSCDFGLTAIDMRRREFIDTYILRANGRQIKINCSAVFGDYLYAFSDSGLMRGQLDNPFLTDMKNWEYVSIDSSRLIANTGCVFNGKLYIGENNPDRSTNRVMSFDGTEWTLVWDSLPTVRSLTSRSGRLVVCTASEFTVYDANLTQLTQYETNNATMAIADGDKVWYSHSAYGMGLYANGQYNAICPAGPPRNNFYNVCYNAGNLLVAPGGVNPPSSNMYRIADVYSFNGSSWTSIDRDEYPEIDECTDIVSFATCGDPNHYVAIIWRYGILEYINGEYQHITTECISDIHGDMVSGCAFDSRGNLWLAHCFAQTPVLVRTADGTMYEHRYGNNMADQRTGKLICTRNDDLWLVQPYGGKILVWNANGTPETPADDNYICFSPSDERERELNSRISDIVQDRNGAIWIASNEGVYVYDHPEYILQGKSFYARYPQMIDEGYYQSLLITEVVNTIAVDGGNRKWIGTESGGIFVISPDGTEQYAVYNKDNSPLFSNNVLSLAIDDDKGIIYIVTDSGLQSAVISSTKPDNEMSSVYASPNPVPHDYFNDVTIRGLAEETVVRITDLRGNLVHETMSNGGSALWNLCNQNGRRVETGIYLIQCTTADGITRNVGKIHVVK